MMLYSSQSDAKTLQQVEAVAEVFTLTLKLTEEIKIYKLDNRCMLEIFRGVFDVHLLDRAQMDKFTVCCLFSATNQ